jgi:hypothetical protein
MKNRLIALAVTIVFLTVANVKADVITVDALKIANAGANNNSVLGAIGANGINDKGSPAGADSLVVWFNDYFGKSYQTGNEILTMYGVDPIQPWKADENTEFYLAGKQPGGLSSTLTLGNSGTIAELGINDTNKTLSYKYESGGLNSEVEGSGMFTLRVNRATDTSPAGSWTLYSDASQNVNGRMYMLAFDVTELFNHTFDTDFASMYLFAWEDWLFGRNVYWNASTPSANYGDWNFADMFVFMGTLESVPTPSPTPEPATLAILGLGLAGLGLTRLRRRK